MVVDIVLGAKLPRKVSCLEMTYPSAALASKFVNALSSLFSIFTACTELTGLIWGIIVVIEVRLKSPLPRGLFAFEGIRFLALIIAEPEFYNSMPARTFVLLISVLRNATLDARSKGTLQNQIIRPYAA